jgi:hypothetical protein
MRLRRQGDTELAAKSVDVLDFLKDLIPLYT